MSYFSMVSLFAFLLTLQPINVFRGITSNNLENQLFIISLFSKLTYNYYYNVVL